jgi:hypothetical protein
LVCPGSKTVVNGTFTNCYNDQGQNEWKFDVEGAATPVGGVATTQSEQYDIGNVGIEFYLDSPNAQSITDSAGIMQWVEVCPDTTYTFLVHAYLDTTIKGPTDKGVSCTITLTFGTTTTTFSLTAIGVNTWSSLVSDAYTTGDAETRTLLTINLLCGAGAFASSGVVDVYFDAVHLVPQAPPITITT